MKKIIAVLVSALLMLSCAITAFAETADTATPDEPVSMRYEVISVKNSPKVYTENDVTLVDYPIYDYDDDYLFEGNYELKVNLEGVEVTFKDNCTGKIYTKVFDGTEPCQIKQIYLINPAESNQVFLTYVSTNPEYWMDIEHFDNVNNGLFFSISVNYKTSDSSLDDNGTSGGNSSDKASTNDVATKDTATKDTVTKSATGGNGAVSDRQPDDCCFGCTCNARCKRCNVRLLQKKD
ncbi:MAG TPA: hypothetical protein OIM34_02465 [Ruminococcus bromii]|nr:hypothetical protein [Ruminococcus bromii]